MGFLGFLKFAFKLFDLLAWPLFGLGFPLYASILAIENNPNSDMRNLVAYWIIFSLNSLFELAFVKLIDRLLFWPYMKLMAVCWLVLPDFNGASYVYDCLLRPCLSVDPRAFIKYLIKPKEYKSLIAENFLAEAERYVEENGSEALEKLLERKSKQKKPDIGVEEIKAITNTEEKETAAAIQSKNKEPTAAKKDGRAVELPETNLAAAATWSKVEVPNVAKHHGNAGEPKGENPAVATEQVKCVEPNLAKNERKTVAAGKTKEKAVAAAGGENKAKEMTDSERLWSCALCQVTITCVENLESHFQGREHKAKRKGLEASKQVNENEGSSYSAATPAEPKNTLSVDRLNETRTEKQEDKVQVNRANEQCKEKEFKNKEPHVAMEDARAVELPEKNPVAATTWSKVEVPNVTKHNTNAGEPKGENPAVATEQVKCVEPNLAQNEKRTFAAGETKENAAATAGGENKAGEITDSEKVQRVLTCSLCQVTIPCEKNFESHFQGRKHKAKWLKASKQENKSKGSCSSAVSSPNETRTEKQEDKVQVNWANKQCKEKEVDDIGGGLNQSKFFCSICDVKLQSESTFASHIGGKKHLKKTQQHMINTLGGGFY